MLFYRLDADGRKIDCTPALKGSVLGPKPASCWIIGNGPSMKTLSPIECQYISESPAAKFAVNYGGKFTWPAHDADVRAWAIKPTHWTAYDMLHKFSQSTLLDPSIMKFIPHDRAVDCIYGGQGIEGCACPNAYVFQPQQSTHSHLFDYAADSISLMRDSLLTAIHIAVMLGYRRIMLLGCELRVTPSKAQVDAGLAAGVDYTNLFRDGDPTDLLSKFVEDIAAVNNTSLVEAQSLLERCERETQYDHGECKGFSAVVRSDTHYWETVQHLRLSSASLCRSGVQIINCTPGSRLVPYFGYTDPWKLYDYFDSEIGNPIDECTYGRYKESRMAPDQVYCKHISPPLAKPQPVESKHDKAVAKLAAATPEPVQQAVPNRLATATWAREAMEATNA